MPDAGSPQRILRLPEAVINQIAAGEVIERPASVVKELLENSLDAGADRISISVKGGGCRLIRAEDNGCGIHRDDLLLAVDRHTTSKLHHPGDLERITTLGFRGEALSSIAAVSRFMLTSRAADAETGWSVRKLSDGGMTDIRPAAHPAGTTVEIQDLFYNTPARRKFLRSEKTEFLHIQELVRKMALSRDRLSLELLHNDRLCFRCSSRLSGPAERVRAIFGEPFMHHALPVDCDAGRLRMWGWLGSPETARSQSDRQYFYLNRRLIRDRHVNHAVRLAFHDLLYPGRQPSYVLYLEMDPGAVDINVHPAKQEVRFRDSRNIHDFIYGALAGVLHSQSFNKDTGDDGYRFPASAGFARAGHPDRFGITVRESLPASSQLPIEPVAGRFPAKDGFKPVAVIQGRFMVVECPAGMVLVDVIRARELVAQVRLKTAIEDGGARRRPVLVPITVTIAESDADRIMQNASLLERTGLVVDRIAPGSIMIRELPLPLAHADATALVLDLIPVLGPAKATAATVDEIIATLAAHASDGASQFLSALEMTTLLSDLTGLEQQIPAEQYQTALRSFDMKGLMAFFRHER